MMDGLNIKHEEIVDRNCEGCVMGKQHQQPFSKKEKNFTTKLLELVHINACGPMNVPSVRGSRYFITFIDDFSRYVTVYMMKQKSKVIDRFKEFVNLVENRTGLKVKQVNFENQAVKRFRSENGGEYILKESQ